MRNTAGHHNNHLTVIVFLFTTLLAGSIFGSSGQITVGVVADGPSERLESVMAEIKNETRLLTEGQYEVHFPSEKILHGQWSTDGIQSALHQAFNDPEVDVVLALGLGSAAAAVRLEHHPKPTIAAFLIDDRAIGAPRAGAASGKPNLTYLTLQGNFQAEVAAFRRVVNFRKLAILTDAVVMGVTPELQTIGHEISEKLGFKVLTVVQRHENDDLLSRLPPDVDAVMIGALPRMNEGDRKALLNQLAERGLPSYSLMGAHVVHEGALLASMPGENWKRLTRRIALDLQSVLLGDRLADLPIAIENRRRLTLNMETARRIGISPSFEVMLEADVLNPVAASSGPVWTLEKVAKTAISENLVARASLKSVEAGRESVKEVRSRLLPQLNMSSDFSRVDGNSLGVVSGVQAEDLGDVSLNLSQILYDESAWANLAIERQRQESRTEEYRQTELDITRDATVAFLDVLQARTLLEIQRQNVALTRDNLDLAHDRVRVGYATQADVFRWESEFAKGQANLMSSIARLKRGEENLNRLLNRPLDQSFRVVPATVDNPSLLINDPAVSDWIGNPAGFRRMSEVLVQQGLENSPEIAARTAQVAAQERLLLSHRRSYWLPTFSLAGQTSRILHDSRHDPISTQGTTDWRVGVNLSLALYEGGARPNRVAGARFTLEQLELQLEDTRLLIDQSIRANLHLAQASFLSIGLNQNAAKAARQNFRLVSELYREGAAGVIDMLDAQSSAVTTEFNAANASYQFLIDLMNLQRSVGVFEFFLDSSDRQRILDAAKDGIGE